MSAETDRAAPQWGVGRIKPEPDRREIAADPRKPKITPHKTALFEVPLILKLARRGLLPPGGASARRFTGLDRFPPPAGCAAADRTLKLLWPRVLQARGHAGLPEAEQFYWYPD